MSIVQCRLVGIGLCLGAFTAFSNPGLLRLHRNMDVNQDETVTEAEFFDFWQADYHRRDKDNDGVLASAEADSVVLKLADRNRSPLNRHSKGTPLPAAF